MNSRYIIIFDGICNFCNGAVNFIIDRDPSKMFIFAPMQSEVAQSLIKKHGINNVGINTFLLIKNNKCYIWTDAAFEISSDLTGYWHLFRVFLIVPRPIRDWFYRLFARNRYFLFGRSDKCRIPSPEISERFLR